MTEIGRVHLSSGSLLEPEIGFSRAVRVGNLIVVSGTAPIADDGKSCVSLEVFEQTRRCLEIAKTALEGLGGSIRNVVRTRVMLTDIADWRDAARAHGEFLGDVRPATTFVQVSRFIDPAWKVEIEVDAVLSDGEVTL